LVIRDRDLDRDDLPFPLNRPLTGQDLLGLFPRLFRPLWSAAANAVRGDLVTITAVQAHKVTVDDGNGGTYTARFLAAYTPTVGDTVLVLRNASQAVVLGPLG
jgi:hypothetical protein